MGLLAAGGLLCVAGNGRSALLIGAGVVLLMVSLIVLFAAYMAGKPTIAVKARLDLVPLAVVNDEIVDFACRHAWCDCIGADVADLRAHPTGLAHARDLRA